MGHTGEYCKQYSPRYALVFQSVLLYFDSGKGLICPQMSSAHYKLSIHVLLSYVISGLSENMNGTHFFLYKNYQFVLFKVKKSSNVEKFQNTALQLLALTVSMNVNSSYGYLTCLKLIYGQILRNLPILLAFFKVSTVVSTVNSTHYSTQSCCCSCAGNFDFKCLLCTLTINKQFKRYISHQNDLNGSKNWNFKRACHNLKGRGFFVKSQCLW